MLEMKSCYCICRHAAVGVINISLTLTSLHIKYKCVIVDVFTFTHTVRRPKIKGQRVELRKQISGRTYQVMSCGVKWWQLLLETNSYWDLMIFNIRAIIFGLCIVRDLWIFCIRKIYFVYPKDLSEQWLWLFTISNALKISLNIFEFVTMCRLMVD